MKLNNFYKSKLKIRSAPIALSLFLISMFAPSHAQKPGKLFFGFGITNHNYLFEGSFGIGGINLQYLSSVNSVPSISLGYRNEKLKSELEVSYYNSFVSSTDTFTDLYYSKTAFSADYTLLLGRFRVGAFYSFQNQRHNKIFSSLESRSNLLNGIGLKLGFEKNDFAFDLRKELLVRFNRTYPDEMEGIFNYWTFRITKRIYIIDDTHNSKKKPGPFHLTLGLFGSGNALKKSLPTQGMVKVFPTIGIEYDIPKTHFSIYCRRAMWLNIEPLGYNFQLTSQINHIGFGYQLKIAQSEDVKIGLHHVWNLDKASLFLDYVEGKPGADGRFNNYENFAIGLDLRYVINKSWDAIMNVDYYYKANPRLGQGLNPESVRLGLLYNIN